MHSRVHLSIIFVLIIVGCTDPVGPDKRADVALYSDRGCWLYSVQAIEKLVEWMGLSIEIIDAEYVRNNSLDGFGVLFIPGGDMYQYSLDLTLNGIKKIRRFVRDGGGYIGICGGSYFAFERIVWQNRQLYMNSLDFFEGTAQGPMNDLIPNSDHGMCRIDIVDKTHPITHNLHDSEYILYYDGPYFIPDDSSDCHILGNYSKNGRPAMAACEFEDGRVFVIGSHPEIEEDSDRDGVDWGEEMFDNGSDWGLLENAVNWCLGLNEENS